MPAAAAHILLPCIVVISILLMLIRPRNIAEVWWVSAGALILIALRLIPIKLAFSAVGEGTDVYLFLIGMMLLAELAREQGVFDWVSSVTVRGAKGSCSRLFFLVYAVGTIVTILMSNDATAVVLTPAILAVIRKVKIAAPSLPLRVRIHRQRGQLRSPHFQPRKLGRLSYRNASARFLARRVWHTVRSSRLWPPMW